MMRVGDCKPQEQHVTAVSVDRQGVWSATSRRLSYENRRQVIQPIAAIWELYCAELLAVHPLAEPLPRNSASLLAVVMAQLFLSP